jgi:alpha-N-arabinofuranosidase
MKHAIIEIDTDAVVAPAHRRLFGSFVEHLGRCVYGGIYEPTHPTATEQGFRQDTIDLVKELGSTTIRYPGGNFVSGYRWEDGVGPRERRPRRVDLAWHTTETNEIGVDEFAEWCRLTGSELMMAVNLGTRGIEEAVDLLEYTNHPSGTAQSDLRIANGQREPYDVRMWCLGNEMDGPWQTGHKSADDYGKLASQVASAMKQYDPSLELVVCGSSSSQSPTFGDWERIVLEHSYEYVDLISCHAYYEQHGDDLGSYLASAAEMEYFIDTVVATADSVGYKLRNEKKIMLSFDEWNIWYLEAYEAATDLRDGWPVAPPLLEDTYTVCDAVVLGDLLMTLLAKADRVTSASLAQLVNVIAPIRTENGGPAWRQTTFFPFSITSRLARGVVLHPQVQAETYETKAHGTVDLVHCVATHDPASRRGAIFLVNRDQNESISVELDIRSFGAVSELSAEGIWDVDIRAKNTVEAQERVVTKRNESVSLTEGIVSIQLPPVSWTAIELTLVD